MEMTLSEAATAVNLTKQALFKAIKEGRLSGQKDLNGKWIVDSSELFRVYQPGNQKTKTKAQECELDSPTVAELRARLDAAADVRRLLEERLARAERELDAANARVDQLLCALPVGMGAGKPVEPSKIEIRPDGQGEAEKPVRRSLWRSIFGRG